MQAAGEDPAAVQGRFCRRIGDGKLTISDGNGDGSFRAIMPYGIYYQIIDHAYQQSFITLQVKVILDEVLLDDNIARKTLQLGKDGFYLIR